MSNDTENVRISSDLYEVNGFLRIKIRKLLIRDKLLDVLADFVEELDA